MITQSLESEDDFQSPVYALNGNGSQPPASAYSESGDPMQTDEVAGDPVVQIPAAGSESTAGDDDEVANPAEEETGSESFEATAEQLAAEATGESAWSDLEGIEGFEMPVAAETNSFESDDEYIEVGELLDGAESAEQAEWGFLASLVPTIATAVGPPLIKAVSKRLKPRTRKRITRIARTARPVARQVVGSVAKRVLRRNGVLSMFAKAFETAEMAPATESDHMVDEALVAETVAVLEVVIGNDDRVRIEKTTNTPWRRICALRIEFPNGKIFRGTGFLIGPRAVATAGHCVYMHSQGGWARKIEVIPGANDRSRPLGSAESRSFRSVGGWVNGRKPESDYGCIVLPSGAFGGRNLGHFGFAAWSERKILAAPSVLAGYPGDKPFAQLWGMSHRIKRVTSKQLIYNTDSAGGQSGAPVYIKRGGNRFVVGIHNYGAQSGNSATRITLPVYRRLSAWSKI